jgi:hypothetical protein
VIPAQLGTPIRAPSATTNRHGEDKLALCRLPLNANYDMNPRRLFERGVYSVVMIGCVRLLVIGFLIVFAAGVTCSVICPERPILPAKNHQEDGPCTDCTSTDFIAGAKISCEKISLNATVSPQPDSFLVLSSRFLSFSVAVSTNVSLEPSPPLLVTHPSLRV